MIEESDVTVKTVCPLGFGTCRLALQAPVANHITDPKVRSFPAFRLCSPTCLLCP